MKNINLLSITKNVFLKTPPEQAKMYFIEHDMKTSETLFTMAYQIKNLLNTSIIFLVLSAFFFTVNGLLVTSLGK
jgi:hypothetical protein